MTIETKVQRVYWAPTRGRRYFDKASAIRAEARAIIRKHCPDEIGCKEPGCDCGDRPWSLGIEEPLRYARYIRLLTKALQVTMK